jgi:hypothetical protein
MGIDVRDAPEPEKVVAVTVPFTSRAVPGFVFPIPTCPLALITTVPVPAALVNTATFDPCMTPAGSPDATRTLLADTVFDPANTP